MNMKARAEAAELLAYQWEHDAKIYKARAEAAENSREMRAGVHLHKTARELGWPDDGEGAQEYLMRRCYEQGQEDALKAEP